MKRILFPLQSGFFVFNTDELVKDEDKRVPLNGTLSGKEWMYERNNSFYSPKVTTLFKRVRADEKLARNFNYRDQVLATAGALFSDTEDIIQWVNLQFESSSLSPYHARFLFDTLKYLETGVRDINPIQYYALLEPDSSPSNAIPVDSVIKNAGKYSNVAISRDNWCTTIDKWLKQPDGFTDLLSTLFVIYGRRDDVLYMTPGVV